MKSITPARIGAGLLALIGLIHLVLVPEYFAEEAYIGLLFIAGAVVAFGLAARLWSGPRDGDWALGALVSAGMACGFVLSRTVGLPGFHEAEWELSGVVSVLAEIGFIGIALSEARGGPARAESARA